MSRSEDLVSFRRQEAGCCCACELGPGHEKGRDGVVVQVPVHVEVGGYLSQGSDICHVQAHGPDYEGYLSCSSTWSGL